MTLLFVESFDHYATALLGAKRWIASAGAGSIDVVGTGRNGSCVFMIDEARSIYKVVGTQTPTVIVGAAVKPANWSANNYESAWISVRLTGVGEQISIRCNTTNGYIAVCRNSTTPIQVSTFSVPRGSWTYFELKVTLATTATGSYEVRANGQTIMSASSVVTATTTAAADYIYFAGNRPSGISFDDIYVCNGSGTTNNDFLGDVKVECLFPSGNGNSSDFTGFDGNKTDNYALVDEASASTTDYVSSSTSGEKDTYAFGDLATTAGTVYGVQTVLYGSKSDAGPRSMTSVARLSTTESDGATEYLPASYLMYSHIREEKPGTGSWTISDVNSAEFGVKVVS